MTRTGIETALFFESPNEMCARVFRLVRPRTAIPEIRIEFCAFANANAFIRAHQGRLVLRISDLLKDAPAPILEALMVILISKLYRKEVPAEFSQRYRRYLNRRDVRKTLETVRQERGRKRIAHPKGQVYDLDQIWDELNFKYFFGLMSRPAAIGWSLKVSRATLGHYDPSHHTIVINRCLDRPAVPRLVVEYVMFHEMLHLRHPAEHRGTRRCVHTREFKAAEKQFDRLDEALALLKKL